MCITFQPRVTKVRSAPGVHRHSMQIQCRTLSSPGSRSSGIKEKENLLSGHFSPFLPLFEKTRSDSKDHPNCCWWNLQITPYVKVWVDMSNLVIRLKKKTTTYKRFIFSWKLKLNNTRALFCSSLKECGPQFQKCLMKCEEKNYTEVTADWWTAEVFKPQEQGGGGVATIATNAAISTLRPPMNKVNNYKKK